MTPGRGAAPPGDDGADDGASGGWQAQGDHTPGVPDVGADRWAQLQLDRLGLVSIGQALDELVADLDQRQRGAA